MRKSVSIIKQKIREHTKCNHSIATADRIRKLDVMIRGWVNYFSIADAKTVMIKSDEMTRVRLRMIIWKQWKNGISRVRNLIKLGIGEKRAYEWSNSRKGYCRLARSPILQRSLNIDHFTKLKYTGFTNYYYWKTGHQTRLF